MSLTCPACRSPLDPALPRAGMGLHPTCDPLDVAPDVVASEIFGIIAAAIDSTPRSMQTRIGPSEIGIPCDRRLAYKMAGTTPTNDRGIAWKPFVGTAVHEQLADIMARAEIASTTAGHGPRWHVEEKVSPGLVLGGEDIDGSCDLYDGHTGLVIDWKITTRNRIREVYRPHGPGDQYEIQAHNYGLGWARKGHPVRTVMIVFLTRDGEFTDRWVWHAPFDPAKAEASHRRVQSIALALDALGPGFTIPAMTTADAYCSFCPYYRKGSVDISRSCPGHPQEATTPTPPPIKPAPIPALTGKARP